jgi:predicted  nucleic acid-binding Zn-ribbon protein
MPGPATILREIHHLQRLAKDLKGRIEKQPLLLKAQQNALDKQEDALREGQETIKHLKVKTHEKEGTLKTLNQQIAKHEKQLNEAASKKEYDALKSEIKTGRDDASRVEDEILDTMAETEERQAQLPQLTKAVQQARDELAQFERDSQARLLDLNEQIQRVQKELADIEATLPPELRPNYDRLVKARGEDALAAVVGRTCQACYTEITAQQSNELLRDQLVACKSCGRMLYIAE